MTIDRVVNNDLLMHGTREHADALRGQPEVRKVVPLLPELKVTPHFDALLDLVTRFGLAIPVPAKQGGGRR